MNDDEIRGMAYFWLGILTGAVIMAFVWVTFHNML